MKPTELLLQYQHLKDRARTLVDERDHLQARLASSPEVEAAAAEVDSLRQRRDELARAVRELEGEVESQRGKMRTHERELMSGRIRSPSDLTRMSAEVEHMKSHVSEEEDRELELLEQLEEAEKQLREAVQELDEVRARVERAGPGISARLKTVEAEMDDQERQQEALWNQVPPDLQQQYRRLSRLNNPVVEVVNGACTGCHVQFTAAELQQLRRDERHTCQNCNRIVVLA